MCLYFKVVDLFKYIRGKTTKQSVFVWKRDEKNFGESPEPFFLERDHANIYGYYSSQYLIYSCIRHKLGITIKDIFNIILYLLHFSSLFQIFPERVLPRIEINPGKFGSAAGICMYGK